MSIDAILEKALEREPLTREEAYELYDNAPLQTLCGVADTLRMSAVNDPTVVTWQIDRNVNITNVIRYPYYHPSHWHLYYNTIHQ